MAKFESVNLLFNLLKQANYPLSKAYLKERLECSTATVERYIAELRDTYGQKVEYSREYKGYQLAYDKNSDIELPSHLFTTQEVNALLLVDKIIDDLEPGFLKQDMQSVKQHLSQIKEKFTASNDLNGNRIRMLNIGKRKSEINNLSQATQAVLERKNITIEYDSRSLSANNNEELKRVRRLSPQRLTHYRDNWYLDAWCHERKALRTFALERITRMDTHKENSNDDNETIINLSESELDAHYAQTFGIFGGAVKHHAILKFTPHRSQWVSEEVWHHQQRGKWLDDGSYQLEIPYGNDTELLGDILKYGDQVEVLAPKELREKIKSSVQQLLSIYK